MTETKEKKLDWYVFVRTEEGTVLPVLCNHDKVENIISTTAKDFPTYKILGSVAISEVPDLETYLSQKYNLRKLKTDEGRKRNCSHRFCVNIEYGENIKIHKILKPFRRDSDNVPCIKVNAAFKYRGKSVSKLTFYRNDGKYISTTAATECLEPTCTCTYGIYTLPITDFDD